MKPSERIKELTNLNLRDFPNLTHVENAVNAMVTYLDEQWGKNQKRIVSNYHQGAGGCCKECEIYLDYKDSYQCNNDDCSCHKEEVKEGSKDIEWEFENWIKKHDTFMGGISSNIIPNLKDFIKDLLSQKEAKIKRELKDKIMGIVVKNSIGFDTIGNQRIWHLDIDKFEDTIKELSIKER